MSDPELEALIRKKMLELQRKSLMREESEKPKRDREIIEPYLTNRADEVLDALRAQYPEVAHAVEHKLAELISQGVLKSIDGGWLYNLLRQMGVRVRLPTRIVYHDRPLEERLREGVD